VYDMYAWDQPASSADEHAEPGVAPGVAPRDAGRAANGTQVAYASHANRTSRADHPGRAVHAVQVALDRRDNGGDAGSGRLG
jgi:hypothetical protein